MVERRSMGAAMKLSPEKLQFITSGSAGTKIEPVEALPQVVAPTVETAEQDSPAAPRSRSRRRPARSDQPLEDYAPRGMRWTSITTRMLPETAGALRRACLEQKLDRLRPDTQQEIVEAAVRRWLSDAGYL